MSVPGFSAEASMNGVLQARYRSAAHAPADLSAGSVTAQQITPGPGRWCDLFPWLCAVCSPCNVLGIQHCCEPGRYICNPICRRQWNCYDRRC
jgi:hypothetical protein